MELVRHMVGFAMLALAAWRVLKISAFIAEDMKWLSDRFGEDESDYRVSKSHSLMIAASFAVIGLALVFD